MRRNANPASSTEDRISVERVALMNGPRTADLFGVLCGKEKALPQRTLRTAAEFAEN